MRTRAKGRGHANAPACRGVTLTSRDLVRESLPSSITRTRIAAR